ncbi:flagellar hook-length control protein FliK [Legionella waltersii]|uniref:Putative flagellar hook-length control protein n=1 Tax=Legionella waltersii TaxID=66969 RepID=A0A0W1A1B1_9GAMM|nr:flagellar hook-length control protein FliK [Legionella waltersii]KTD75170.1 putative flagellar hook-length control protein [Legionella waltersii]SNV04690.1 flagellar hook-length control protein FliK [Legionella waltersii]
MIESNNLLLSTLGNLNSTQDIPDNKLAAIFSDEEDLSKDELDKLSPQSFVLLMAQILTVQSNGANPEQRSTITTVENKSVSLNNEIITMPDAGLNESNQVFLNNTQTPLFSKESSLMSQEQTPFPKNIALTWIDAEGFLPPKGLTQDLRTELYPVVEGELPSFDEFNEKLLPVKELQLKAETKNQTIIEESVGELLAKNTTKTTNSFATENNSFTASDNVALPSFQANTTPIHSLAYTTTTPDYSQIQSSAQHKSIEIPVPLNSSQWTDQFAEQIVWLGHHSIKTALIKIHPEELGPIEINIKVVKDAASVNIATHSTLVKDVVDQAIPRLREMMAEQGIHLSDVNIQSDSNPRQFSQQNNDALAVPTQESEQEIQATTTINRRPPKGLIDYFA